MTQPVAGVPAPPTCPRHPDRISYMRCQRCDRPTCPECQRPAPVGFHCVDCVAQARASHPVARTIFGGAVTDGRPLASYVLIGLCAVAYVLQLVIGDTFTLMWDFSPLMGRVEPWRFLTSAFLHGSSTHILFNMFALWTVGQSVEPLLGRARFVAVYLLSAFGGAIGYLLLATPPQTPARILADDWVVSMVGASGAVFGLFAALMLVLRHLGRSIAGLVGLLLINAAMPLFYRSIAWQAHVGGFLTGAALVAILIATRDRSRRHLQWPAIGGVAAVLVALVLWKYGTASDGYVRSVFGV